MVVAGRVAAAGRKRWASAAAPLCVIFRRIPAVPPARGLIGSGRHCLVASDARERNIVLVTVSLFCDLSMRCLPAFLRSAVLPPVLILMSGAAAAALAVAGASTEFTASDFPIRFDSFIRSPLRQLHPHSFDLETTSPHPSHSRSNHFQCLYPPRVAVRQLPALACSWLWSTRTRMPVPSTR